VVKLIIFLLVLAIVIPYVRKVLARVDRDEVVRKRGFTNPTTGRADSEDYVVRQKVGIEKQPGFFTLLINSFRKPELPGYMREAGEDDYTRLLKFFGLTDAATDEEVRKVYRERVKETHPDVISGVSSDKEACEKFHEIKTNYNRLMNVRKSMFGR
jgi:hypothetical protein